MGTIEQGGTGPCQAGWTYGPGLNIKAYCHTCQKSCIICYGLGEHNLALKMFRCSRGCGSQCEPHGVLLGGYSHSRPGNYTALHYTIKGMIYPNPHDHKHHYVKEEIDKDDTAALYHNEFYVFKETEKPLRYAHLVIHCK